MPVAVKDYEMGSAQKVTVRTEYKNGNSRNERKLKKENDKTKATNAMTAVQH